jgi:beta-barrel assembly-enhancing protease
MNSYRANAFAPHTGAKVHPGQIRVESANLLFESPSLTGNLPLHGMIFRRGGHNDEQLFFEHPEFPGWSIYSGDPALLQDVVLNSDPRFAQVARGVIRSRKSIPLPVIFLLGLMTIVLGLFVLLWTQKDRIVEYIADKIPISWEVTFGDQALDQIRRGGTFLTDTPWSANLNEITNRLLKAVSASPYPFRFHVLDDTNVNAFAMPGGNVVILSGLLQRAENGEEVAGVLAHELAHITRRHSLRNIIKSAGLIVTVQAIFGDTSGLAGLATEGSRYLLQQKFSRDFEREADDTGWTYLLAANIDPRGLTSFFEKLKALTAESGMNAIEGSLSLLNTHPASTERIERLEQKWHSLETKTFVPLVPWPKMSAP